MAEEKDTICALPPHPSAAAGVCRAQLGITRILNGDALLGEHDRLRDRISILFDKLETQIKKAAREVAARGQGFQLDETMLANLLLAYTEGRISQFVRSGVQAQADRRIRRSVAIYPQSAAAERSAALFSEHEEGEALASLLFCVSFYGRKEVPDVT